MKVAINGFGRIGRSFLRSWLSDKSAQQKIEIAAINIGPAKKEWVAHLFKYDTFMGNLSNNIRYEQGELQIDSISIPIYAEIDAKKLPWQSLGIDWVVDASGKFTTKHLAEQHRSSGAKKVMITAFAENPDVTVVMGVNDDQYDAKSDHVMSLASCTGNALAPIIKVLHEQFSLSSVIINTMHSYTNRQVLMDVESVNLRRSRAAAMNIIPTTLQAPCRLREVYPQFSGPIEGQSTRVPIGKVSLLDVAFTTEKKVSVLSLNDAFMQASQSSMKSIIGISEEELVSSDYVNNLHSVTIDAPLTTVCGQLGKVYGWYDNEAGYSHRIKDFLIKHG